MERAPRGFVRSTKMVGPIKIFIAIALGVAFFSQSGKAEGFGSLSSIFAVGILAWAVVLVIKMILTLRPKYSEVGSLVFLLCSLLAGGQLSRHRISETQKQGDLLVQKIWEKKKEVGRFPRDHAEFTSWLGPIPKPALQDTSFYYAPAGSDFTLSFSSTAFMICRRTGNLPEWVCDD
jgi:hypothetical protein